MALDDLPAALSLSRRIGARLSGLSPLTIVFLAFPALGADLVVINNGLTPPSLANVISAADGSTYANSLIHVHNAGCYSSVNPCPAPGGDPTSVSVVDGAVVGSSVVAFETSRVEMSGGTVGGILGAVDAATALLSGGTVGSNLGCSGSASCLVTGGSVAGNIGGADTASIEWQGGIVDGDLVANDSSEILIVGSDFAVDGVPVPYGLLAASTGRLSGTLQSGDPVDNDFRHRGADLFATGVIALQAARARFQGLGTLPEASGYSDAKSISGDGAAVVGVSGPGSAFRWTREEGILEIPPLEGGDEIEAEAISEDGSVVVGGSDSTSGRQAFRWTAAGAVGLGDLEGGVALSRAFGVSADGTAIVGEGYSDQGNEAFVWTAGEGFLGLGDLPGGPVGSVAYDVSSAGDVVVGQSFSEMSGGRTEAFRWTSEGGMVGLGDLPGGVFSSGARAISGNGLVIAGSSSSEDASEAFRWTAATGMVGLGSRDATTPRNSEILGASYDGSVLVGAATSDSGGVAIIWDESSGMRALKEVLEDFGLDLSDWTLLQANAVSDDGSTVVGLGTNPEGEYEGWVAYIPEPGGTSLSLTAVGALVALRRGRAPR